MTNTRRPMRERILKDDTIPAKYKFLMAMITDAIAAHPDGVRTLAGNARAAVNAALVIGGTAFQSS